MADITKERCMELLGAVIDSTAVSRREEDTIRELLYKGFTGEELIENFGFDETKVREVAESMVREMNERESPTFGNLYEVIDFTKADCLKYLKGSDWELEVRKDDGKEFIVLYKRFHKNDEFYKQLEIHFKADAQVVLCPRGVFNKSTSEDLVVFNDHKVDDNVLFSGLMTDPEIGYECKDFLLRFIRAMKS